mmetsp:Transcript_33194/g.54798  ORF Transcript_33194/g.54798 Transcript_33194/m.54798 type:complete len:113 (-) Transcript_33194:205-543(-)
MIRTVITRMPRTTMMTTPRFLSGQGESALHKLQQVMQEYRLEHYTQETPYRFKRDIVTAAKGSDDKIVLESMQRVLHNIGASQRLSEEELRTIFSEVGESGAIPADRMVQLL